MERVRELSWYVLSSWRQCLLIHSLNFLGRVSDLAHIFWLTEHHMPQYFPGRVVPFTLLSQVNIEREMLLYSLPDAAVLLRQSIRCGMQPAEGAIYRAGLLQLFP